MQATPTETLHVTIERNLSKEQSRIPKSTSDSNLRLSSSRSAERLLDRSDSIPENEVLDDRKRERSLSFFNFSIFKRTTSDSTDSKAKAHKARLKKNAEQLENEDPPVTSFAKTTPSTIRRSRSLTEINWYTLLFLLNIVYLRGFVGYFILDSCTVWCGINTLQIC